MSHTRTAFATVAQAVLLSGVCLATTPTPSPFTTFNELVMNETFRIPPFSISEDGGNFSLVRNGMLRDVAVQDLQVTGTRLSDTEYQVHLLVDRMSGKLDGEFSAYIPLMWNITHISGDGNMTLEFHDFTFEVTINLFSDNSTSPPTRAKKHSCSLKTLGLHLSNCHGISGNWWLMCQTASLGADLVDYIVRPFLCLFLDVGPLVDKKLTGIARKLLNLDAHPTPVAPPVNDGEVYTKGLESTTNFNTTSTVKAFATVQNVFNVPGSGKWGGKSSVRAERNGDPQPLVINQLVDKLLPKDHVFHPMDYTLPTLPFVEGGTLDITIYGVTLIGLDTITNFDVATVLSNHTLGMNVAMSQTTLGVTMQAAVAFPDTIVQGGGHFTSNVSLNLSLDEVSAGLNLVLGMNASELMDVQVGSLLSLSTLPACLMSTVKAVNITHMHLSIEALTTSLYSAVVKPSIPTTGGINTLLNNLAGVVDDLYVPYVLKGLPFLMETQVRPILNLLIGMEISEKKPCEFPSSSKAVPRGAAQSVSLENKLVSVSGDPVVGAEGKGDADVIFADSAFIHIVDALLDGVLGDFHSDMSINDFIMASLKQSDNFNGTALNLGTVLSINGQLVQKGTPVDVYMGIVNLTVSEVSVSGLTSFQNLSVLLPVPSDEYELDNHIALGGGSGANGASPDPLTISARFYLQWSDNGPLIENDVRVTLSLSDWETTLDAVLRIFNDKFSELQVREVSEASCLYSAMDTQGLRMNFSEMRFGDVQMRADCISCTGDSLNHWTKKLPTADAPLTDAVNSLLDFFVGNLTNPVASEKFDYNQENAVCGEPLPSPAPEESHLDNGGKWVQFSLVGFTLVFICVFLPLYTLVKVYRALHSDPHAKPLMGECQDDDIEDDTSTVADGVSAWDILRMDEAIFAHPVVPVWFRYGVPVVLVLLMGAMLSSHLYYENIAMNARLWVGGQQKEVAVYRYTTIKVMKDGWNAHVADIAVGLGFLSFTWAWIKIALLFWAFFVPPTVMSHGARTSLIGFLDYTAKYSLIDTYMNLLLVPFANIKVSPDQNLPYWDKDLIGAGLVVERYYGYYMFAGVQFFNLLVGQMVMFHNRNVVASVRKDMRDAIQAGFRGSVRSASSARSVATTTWFAEGAEDDRREALKTHLHLRRTWFSCCVKTHPEDLKAPAPIAVHVRLLVFLSLVGCIALVIAGSVTDSMGVKDKGMLSELIDGTPDLEVTRKYTIFSMLKLFLDSDNNFGADILNWILVISIVTFGLVVPILSFVAWLGMWFVPLKLSEQKKLYFIAECLASWSSLDVFVMAVVLITLDIGKLVKFVCGNKYFPIDDVLVNLQTWGFYNREPVALAAEGVWCVGLVLLFAGAVLANVVYVTLSIANLASVKDRERQAWILNRERARTTDDQSSRDSLHSEDEDLPDDPGSLPRTPPGRSLQRYGQ
eukprot:TRINITY_DN7678_c0_g1_i1.p1 TRINITY_DN7678_c0_g1~~TRINITY_DN7678_c0_g1_i1.p1  ORF type:complete len:1440 (+),score=558.18 TRINITY_DN7678_c0_g1_i1:228-4547(+)